MSRARRGIDNGELSPLDIRIYTLLLESKEPLSVRDIASVLDASPSTVHYHVKKLKRLGLIQDGEEGYVVVGKVTLEDYIVIGRKVVPRLIVYSFFFLGLFLGQLVVALHRGEFTIDSLVAITTSLTAFTLMFLEGYRYRKRILI
ncbi:MAG: winged helix-turn-helix domain-containing protein [Desulfurococcaceae archaeon]